MTTAPEPAIWTPPTPRWYSPFPYRGPVNLPATDWSLYDLYMKMEMPIVPLVDAMMKNGMGVDREILTELSEEFAVKQEEHTQAAADLVGVQWETLNLASTEQMRSALFDILDIRPVGKTPGGQWSTDENALKKIQEVLDVDITAFLRLYEDNERKTPITAYMNDVQRQAWFMFHLLEFRQFDKLKDSYVDKMLLLMDEQNRIYTTLKQTRVVSGRLSSSEPFNLMAIPKDGYWAKRIRKAFRPRPGYAHMALDFSQIEMRVTAHASHDPNMMIAFITDQDIHTMTAAQMFNLPIDQVDPDLHRYPAKRVGFGTQFGLTETGLLPHLPPVNRNVEYARAFIERYFTVYAEVRRLINEVVSDTRRWGYTKDLFGRMRYMPEVGSAIQRIREEGERECFSHFIQGTAQGCIKLPMGDTLPLIEHYGLDCFPLIQIHDEMDFEVRIDQLQDAAEIFGQAYANGVRLDIPIKVEVEGGPSWGEMKKLVTVTSK